MPIRTVTRAEAARLLTWPDAVAALRQGHALPPPAQGDLMLEEGDRGLLTRAARIPGLGYAVKAETIFETNAAQGLPSVQGAVLLFDDRTGAVRAIIDSSVVTQFKTVADSLLGASLLARPEARHLVILGAGVVARDLVAGYAAQFPGLTRISVWARNPDRARSLVAAAAAETPVALHAVTDLAAAVGTADIIATATMARDPILHGGWIAPGTHVDLIGGFTPQMREADDDLIARAALWVDCRATTVGRVGDLTRPMAAGIIGPQDVRGDLYDLVPLGPAARPSADAVTLFKNGGGAHLDLMIADLIARKLGIGRRV